MDGGITTKSNSGDCRPAAGTALACPAARERRHCKGVLEVPEMLLVMKVATVAVSAGASAAGTMAKIAQESGVAVEAVLLIAPAFSADELYISDGLQKMKTYGIHIRVCTGLGLLIPVTVQGARRMDGCHAHEPCTGVLGKTGTKSPLASSAISSCTAPWQS